MNQGRPLTKREQKIQAALEYLTDGEPLTTEAEREEHESPNSVTVLPVDDHLVLDVAA